MAKTILRLIRDIWADGYKFLGAIAPVLSISFTIAKAAEVHVSLQDISYAWALAPLLAWLFVAYVRRWLAYIELEGDAEQRSNVFARLVTLSPETQKKLCRVIKAEIALHQLDVDARSELEREGITKSGHAYEAPELIEQYRPFIKQWCKKLK